MSKIVITNSFSDNQLVSKLKGLANGAYLIINAVSIGNMPLKDTVLVKDSSGVKLDAMGYRSFSISFNEDNEDYEREINDLREHYLVLEKL